MSEARPVELRFCMDVEYLEPVIDLGFIDGVAPYEDLDSTALRKYVDKTAEKYKQEVTLEALDTIIRKQLHMDMKDRNAKSRMHSIFKNFVTTMLRNGLKWILESNQKVAAAHVLSEIKPNSLHDRSRSDIDL